MKYVLDPTRIDQFEEYGKMWIPLVNKFGGQHLGYFSPHEGANNIGYALFNFPSLATYEKYRTESMSDPDCIAAYKYAEDTNCIISYERSFLKPVDPS